MTTMPRAAPVNCPPPLSRRAAASALLLAAPAVLLGRGVAAQSQARRATPAQTEGPFYPVQLPADSDFDLLRNGTLDYAGGQPAWVTGTVTDLDGRPLRGAQVEIWQCDEAGHYHHPGDGDRAARAFQGFGKTMVNMDGAYRFRTIRPTAYSGRAPHIHVKVRLGTRDLLTTQLYVAGDPRNARDFLWRHLASDADRAALTAPFIAGPDGLRAQFPIVVAA